MWLFLFISWAYGVVATPDLPKDGVLSPNVDSFFDINIDYNRFMGRVTDKDLTGNILKIETEIVSLEINKKKPENSEIKLSKEIDSKNTSIIIVDDVIKSGKTLFYSLKPFYDMGINEIQTLILVQRKHKRFPIIADFVGMSLNTTLKERIEVKVKGKKVDSIELE